MTSVAVFSLLAVTLLTGTPIAIAIIATVMLSLLIFTHVPMLVVVQQMFNAADSFTLMAIPFFVLSGNIMTAGGISGRLIRVATAIFGQVAGGLAIAATAACAFFAAISGSSPATVAAIGAIMIPALMKAKYDEKFSVGIVTAAGSLGIMIPPSIPMVVYAMVSGESVAKLFFGGAVPGLLIGLALMSYIYFVARKRNYPCSPRQSLAVLATAFIQGFLPLLTPTILLGGIWLGFVTITEAAALAVAYTLALGAGIYRKLGFAELLDCLKSVAMFCGPILILLPAAKVFGFVLTSENIPMLFSQYVLGISENPIFILLMINVLFLVLGCLSDPTVNIMLFVPIVMPLARTIGMDPTHFGVMIVLNCMIGLITPPVGTLLFCLCGFEKMSLEVLVKAIWPFIWVLLGVLVLITAFPALVLTLPNLLFS